MFLVFSLKFLEIVLSRYARKNMPAPDLPLPAAIENPKISVSPMGFSGTARRRGVTKRRRRAAVRRPPWPPCLKGAVAGACDGDWGIRRSSPAKKACSFERIPPPQCSHWAPPLGKGGYARTSGVITAPMGRSYPISDNSELRIPNLLQPQHLHVRGQGGLEFHAVPVAGVGPGDLNALYGVVRGDDGGVIGALAV